MESKLLRSSNLSSSKAGFNFYNFRDLPREAFISSSSSIKIPRFQLSNPNTNSTSNYENKFRDDIKLPEYADDNNHNHTVTTTTTNNNNNSNNSDKIIYSPNSQVSILYPTNSNESYLSDTFSFEVGNSDSNEMNSNDKSFNNYDNNYQTYINSQSTVKNLFNNHGNHENMNNKDNNNHNHNNNYFHINNNDNESIFSSNSLSTYTNGKRTQNFYPFFPNKSTSRNINKLSLDMNNISNNKSAQNLLDNQSLNPKKKKKTLEITEKVFSPNSTTSAFSNNNNNNNNSNNNSNNNNNNNNGKIDCKNFYSQPNSSTFSSFSTTYNYTIPAQDVFAGDLVPVLTQDSHLITNGLKPSPSSKEAIGSYFYQLKAEDSAGNIFDFANLRNQVVLVINISGNAYSNQTSLSKYHFTVLEKLYQKYHLNPITGEPQFEIIAFPCDQFFAPFLALKNTDNDGNKVESPVEADSQLREYLAKNYNITFPLLRRIKVNGKYASDIYKFLKNEKNGVFGKSIKWNFEKFVIDKYGNVIKRSTFLKNLKLIEDKIFNLIEEDIVIDKCYPLPDDFLL
ncbi:thioredoxin-like protein [Ascoidea rubescens DSM 1968]|uniref:Thioredoxin-like protein n=1 Tax=Ascoidea rubescens DSM 1968 TaxID=1344418 RepID=A0A1D2VL94_9ASCO|nr:thioredoxin-like protein [Ascoidea rubescens DSM 1968]ODV62390.1 thioredoxin-like protein [Ascoidea rubescens DSM 1968]